MNSTAHCPLSPSGQPHTIIQSEIYHLAEYHADSEDSGPASSLASC